MRQLTDVLGDAREAVAARYSEYPGSDLLSALESACRDDADMLAAVAVLDEVVPWGFVWAWTPGKTQADVLKLLDAARLRAERGNK